MQCSVAQSVTGLLLLLLLCTLGKNDDLEYYICEAGDALGVTKKLKDGQETDAKAILEVFVVLSVVWQFVVLTVCLLFVSVHIQTNSTI